MPNDRKHEEVTTGLRILSDVAELPDQIDVAPQVVELIGEIERDPDTPDVGIDALEPSLDTPASGCELDRVG